ncbi:MAG: hypothetical protein LH461_06260 [Spirochaetaceae bacterium]|nr:hypothetical protein [Spirochaetaceae bacterium]
MDSARVLLLRDALAQSGWIERTRSFSGSLRRVPEAGRLLLVGTPDEEPWHLAAHLDDESRLSGLAQLSPTLVRWAPPSDAPAHLSVTMSRLEAATRGETVFVVAPDAPPEFLLERVADARRTGATILSIDDGDDDLAALAHDRIVVPTSLHQRLVVTNNMPVDLDIDAVSHLVSVAAGENLSRDSMRDRVARMLERLSGPAPRA